MNRPARGAETVNGADLVRGWRLGRVRASMAVSLARHALDACGDPLTALRVTREVIAFAHEVGPWPSRMITHRGRVFGRIARPGFPSLAFERLLEVELNRHAPTRPGFDLSMALLAVTRRCGLRCQHCSEWETRNEPDPLSVEELRDVVAALLERGVSHLELTGGEPLLRMDAVEALGRDASQLADVWVLTSGAPMTADLARRLAHANITGVMVSLDHWDAHHHDAFRGVEGAFDHALAAMTLAREAGLLVGASFTATRETANARDLLGVVGVARERGASFVRLLDPKPAGRWSGADVALGPEHRAALADASRAAEAEWPDDAPFIEESDAVARARGCQGAGRHYVFVDAAGDAHACPFCHASAGNVLRGGLDAALSTLRARGCPSGGDEGLVTLHGRHAA